MKSLEEYLTGKCASLNDNLNSLKKSLTKLCSHASHDPEGWNNIRSDADEYVKQILKTESELRYYEAEISAHCQ